MDEYLHPPAVEVCSLDVQIEAARLLENVDIEARRGQFVGVIGPNGAGKSTLLRAISGVLKRQAGSVTLQGRELQSLSSRDVAEIVALVPQIAPFTQGFTSLELVLMGRYPRMGRLQIEGAADRRAAADAMQLTDTEAFSERTLDTLSGGERQRVFLARALAQQPQVLLLDEPTSNLDILHQLKILTLVRQLVDEGLTAIAAIHDLNLAARFCDRLVLLTDGRVVTEGSPLEVLTPEHIERAFGVKSAIYREPISGALAISLLAPADDAALHFDWPDEPQLAHAAAPGSHGRYAEIPGP